ncbi:MAG TPA: 3-dehydroquinate synthase [Dehalococcoidia bacterium]|nr:3-dehydroquinate synthase [Dehalococcoidia bacterium]
MSACRRLTITGFMGTGKSTVARLVAKRLGWDAVDSDDLVTQAAGKGMDRIFHEEGEAAMRGRELEVFRALASRQDVVVSAGGGAMLLEETRRLIVESGLVVCLTASPDTITVRLDAEQASARPMIATWERGARVRRLLDQRAAVYDLADFTIATDVLSPEEVAEEVVRLFRTYGERAWRRPGRVEELTRTPSILPPIVDAPGAAVIVRTPSADYPVYVGWGELERLGEHVRRATGSRRAFLVSDQSVMRHWGEVALAGLRAAGLETVASALPPGDGTKSLASAGKLYGWLAEHRAERKDSIVALGGGMVGDLAGFVAATYMRGVPVVQVPTTLLGMVDASIGGKTAVNHAGIKNIVGAFYQPRAVVADAATLKTLPRRELVEGMGEVIKHALIADASLPDLLEARLEDLLALDQALTTDVVSRNIQIKASIVSRDERETGGVREFLNYGHTLGHAFEAAGDYQALLHGEAVAAGMMAAATIGVRMGVTPSGLLERQRRLIERAGLPLRPPPGLDAGRVREALALDKKVVSGTQRWVLLEDVGRPVIRDDVPTGLVEEVLRQLNG